MIYRKRLEVMVQVLCDSNGGRITDPMLIWKEQDRDCFGLWSAEKIRQFGEAAAQGADEINVESGTGAGRYRRIFVSQTPHSEYPDGSRTVRKMIYSRQE